MSAAREALATERRARKRASAAPRTIVRAPSEKEARMNEPRADVLESTTERTCARTRDPRRAPALSIDSGEVVSILAGLYGGIEQAGQASAGSRPGA